MVEICIGGEGDQTLHFHDGEYNATHTYNLGFNPKGVCYSRGLWYCVDTGAQQVAIFNSELVEVRRFSIPADSRGVHVIDNMIWITRKIPFKVYIYDLEGVLVKEVSTTNALWQIMVMDGNIHGAAYNNISLDVFNKEMDMIDTHMIGGSNQGVLGVDGNIHITEEIGWRVRIYDKEYSMIKEAALTFAPHGIGCRR